MEQAALMLAVTIAEIVLVNVKNIVLSAQKAKLDDGKITQDELLGIAFNAAIQSCRELRTGDLQGLVRGK